MATPLHYDVVFRYVDDDADPEDDMGGWQRQSFLTRPEAEAFALGITYGDEPLYEVDGVEEVTRR